MMISLRNLKLHYVNLAIKTFYILTVFIIVIYIKVFLINTKSGEIKGVASINLSDYKNISIPTRKQKSPDPTIFARNYALFDVESGSMLYGNGYDRQVPIASITKLMTALIIIEENDLSNIATVPKEASLINGSIINLLPGEQITVKSLLTGLLLNSGNDAAYALAYYNVTNNEPEIEYDDAINKFVIKMNIYSTKYNLQNTKYLDPAGLDDNAYSTARDQGLLLSYLLNFDIAKQIINIGKSDIFSVDGRTKHILDNSNRLVKDEMHYTGIIGGKTGFTPTSGHNLITAASRNTHTLIAVIFSTTDTSKSASAIEAAKLLDWGFNNIVWQSYAEL